MQFHWTYTGCDNAEQTEIAEAWRTRQAEIEAKADLIGSDGSSQLIVAVEHADSSPVWSMHAAMYAPQGSMVVDARADDLIVVLDHLVGGLSQQIDLQADGSQTIAERRRGLNGFLPFLQSFHREGLSREFLTVLTPVANSFRSYIQRELRTRRAVDQLASGQTTVRDVIDDVLLRAWERFGQRPEPLPLDGWLIRLIDEALEELGQPIAPQSLDDRQPITTTEPRESQGFEQVEQVSEPETIALSQLIAQRADIEPWDRLDVDTKQVQLDVLLRRLPRSQRQVLMLHAVEGYSETEIADLQDRTPDTVAADLAEAVRAVQGMFTDDGWPELQERLEREALQRPRRSHRT